MATARTARRRRGHQQPDRRTNLRGMSALLMLSFVLAQLGSFAHALAERHERCAEHGELIHVEASAAADALEAPAAGHEHDHEHGDTPVLAAAPDAGEHGHDHCHLGPLTRETQPVERAEFALAPPVQPGLSAALPPLSTPRTSARYAFAPKTSPPAPAA